MTATTHTIVGLYDSRGDAEDAVQDLVKGFSRDHISIVARDLSAAPPTEVPNIGPLDEVGSTTTAGTGAAAGGIAGFIVGIAALAIPGIGPIIAAGPLAAGIMGAGIGAATGGIAGALKDRGIPEEHARRYSSALRRGSCLVTVYASEGEVNRAADILERNGAVSIDEPDEQAGASIGERKLTPEAIEAAKLKPGEGVRDKQRQSERRVDIYPGVTGIPVSPGAVP
jgi:uncharacterized membrane protein